MSDDEEPTVEIVHFSSNLVILFLIECVVLVCALILIITKRNLLHGTMKLYAVFIPLTMIVLGIYLLQDPKNSTTDSALFTMDFIIMPAIVFSITVAKLAYEKMASGQQGHSITHKSRASSRELAILAATGK